MLGEMRGDAALGVLVYTRPKYIATRIVKFLEEDHKAAVHTSLVSVPMRPEWYGRRVI